VTKEDVVVRAKATLVDVVPTPRGDLATIAMTGVVDGAQSQPGAEIRKQSYLRARRRWYVATGLVVYEKSSHEGRVDAHAGNTVEITGRGWTETTTKFVGESGVTPGRPE
jgi:hypothetical protein